jgi:hypothetical protein
MLWSPTASGVCRTPAAAGPLGVVTMPLVQLLARHVAPRAQLLHQRGALVPLVTAVLQDLNAMAAADPQLVPTLG